jgi:hypothetical protein
MRAHWRNAVADSNDSAASPEAAISQAFDVLFAQLLEAKRRFENGDHAGRDGVIHALESVLKFLGLFEQVQSAHLHAPLAALFDALLHLDDGETHPMLDKVKHSGRARASAGRESLKGFAAFTVDRLCALGIPQPKAHETVARVLESEGVSPARGKGPITGRTVRLWCQHVAADVGRHGEAAQAFDFLQRTAAARGELDSPEELLLERLKRLVRDVGLGKKPLKPPS